MYMLVFVTLIIAIIGAYAQVYTKQAANGFAQQTGVADAMLAWHTNAADLANDTVAATSFTTTGCSLTANQSLFSNDCKSSPGGLTVHVNGTQVGSLCVGVSPPNVPCWVPLPASYNYTFYSVIYQSVAGSTTTNYLLTYVPPPQTGSDPYGVGFVCLPGNLTGTTCATNPLTLSFNQLYQQLRKNKNISPLSYGRVLASGSITLPAILPGQTAAATIPVPASIPTGSIGLIAQVNPCSNC